MKKQLLSLVAVMALGVTAGSAWALTQKKMVVDNGQVQNMLGFSVSIKDDLMVAGNPDHDMYMPMNNTAGSVYVFEKDGLGEWDEIKKIVAPDGKLNDGFGYDVDFDGLRIIAGAPSHDIKGNNAGAAYIVNWPQNSIKKLLPNDIVSKDAFGWSVSIDGNYAIVGAPQKTVQGFPNAGVVYFFERNNNDNWVQVAKFNTPNPGQHYWFGRDVSIKGNRAVVASIGIQKYAAVQVYERYKGKWIWTSTIASQTPLIGGFGSSIAQEEDRIVVGDPQYGRVYVYKDTYPGDEVTSAWFLESTLQGPLQNGRKVAISGDYIAASGSGDITWDKIYIYKKTPKDQWNDQWSQYTILKTNPYVLGEDLGTDVDIDGCGIVGGTTGEIEADYTGAVYYFTDIGIPCN